MAQSARALTINSQNSSRVKASGLFKLCLAIVAALGYGMVTQYTY